MTICLKVLTHPGRVKEESEVRLQRLDAVAISSQTF